MSVFNILEDFESTIIKLAKTWNIPPLEPEDIANELRLHLFLHRNQFNPKKAKYENWAYITCRNKIKDLAKYWKRSKRDHSKIVNLEELQEKGLDINTDKEIVSQSPRNPIVKCRI